MAILEYPGVSTLGVATQRNLQVLSVSAITRCSALGAEGFGVRCWGLRSATSNGWGLLTPHTNPLSLNLQPSALNPSS